MHDIHQLWFSYFIPSLWGNGPEALVQTVVYGVAAWIFIPKVRKYVDNHVKSIHERLERHHAEAMAQADDHHQEHLRAIKGTKKRDANGRFAP